ncbi:hypothetical protein rsdtw13_36600 [Clostridium sp. TW13]|uniref:Uncharacterized protein n=1 Tax=Inconstantimicrobium mannanitabidum TaxID=1604901 RepID=A0ACB5RH49_9CLOT|nr:hypothetical protein rsdtw13_36600 [Clostridium sp. TW13]
MFFAAQAEKNCAKTNLCNKNCGKFCNKCKLINCYRTYNEYSTNKCYKLSRFPYVYNGCSPITACSCEKYIIRLK